MTNYYWVLLSGIFGALIAIAINILTQPENLRKPSGWLLVMVLVLVGSGIGYAAQSKATPGSASSQPSLPTSPYSGASAPVAPVTIGAPSSSGLQVKSSINSPSTSGIISSSPPTQPAVASPSTTVPVRSSSIILDITVGTPSDKVGPNTYRNPLYFGWSSDAYDSTGQLGSGCYVSWTLYENGSALYETMTHCHEVSPPNVKDLGPGAYQFTGKVTTDWGATGSKTVNFTVAG